MEQLLGGNHRNGYLEMAQGLDLPYKVETFDRLTQSTINIVYALLENYEISLQEQASRFSAFAEKESSVYLEPGISYSCFAQALENMVNYIQATLRDQGATNCTSLLGRTVRGGKLDAIVGSYTLSYAKSIARLA